MIVNLARSSLCLFPSVNKGYLYLLVAADLQDLTACVYREQSLWTTWQSVFDTTSQTDSATIQDGGTSQ